MATRLDLQYRSSVRQARVKVERFAIRKWDGLGSWREADYDRFVAQVVPRIEMGQQQVANLTDSYVRKLALDTFGGLKSGGAFRATTAAIRGVSSAYVYRRPFVSAYAALGEGKSMSAALSAGRERLSDLVRSGSQLAKTHAAREAIGRTRFLGFQRVLTGQENCALCVIASTQRYNRGDLLPIHPGCDCDCKPLHGEFDKQVIAPELLDQTYSEIATRLDHVKVGLDARDLGLGKSSSSGQELSDYTDLIVQRDHGELGPVLTWRSDHFTSAQDIAALA